MADRGLSVVVVSTGNGQPPLLFGPFADDVEAAKCRDYHIHNHPGDVVQIHPVARPLEGKPCMVITGRKLRIVA